MQVVFFYGASDMSSRLLNLCGIALATVYSSSAFAASKPKLVVVLVIDQMRYDSLERFRPLFAEGGFKRLMRQGARFENAHHDFAPTFTAPGHATIATGSYPSQHGIVANSWIKAGTTEKVDSVADHGEKLVLSPAVAAKLESDSLAKVEEAASPRNLLVTTLGDMLRISSGFRSKVVSISSKARSAVLPGGFSPNAVFWLSEKNGSFVSSTYYSTSLPSWVNQFHETHPVEGYRGKAWSPLEKVSKRFASAGKKRPEKSNYLGTSFPYVLANEKSTNVLLARQLAMTPFANTLLFDFALAAVDNEKLGSDADTDLLMLSISATDLLGHSFGPDSIEVMDMFVRLDVELAKFLSHLDRRHGKDYTIVLTADHGVANEPDDLVQRGIPAGRVSPKIKETLKARFEKTFGSAEFLLSFANDQLYLSRSLAAQRKIGLENIRATTAEAVANEKAIVSVLSIHDCKNVVATHDLVKQRYCRGFHEERSGDLVFVLKPHYFFTDPYVAVTHGSAYDYDTHVPLIFMGAGVRPGTHFDRVATVDVAPTLSALLGIEAPPAAVGNVLGKVF